MTYDVDEDRLAEINHIKDPTQLKVNQKVFIPGVTHLRNVPATVARPSTVRAPAQTSSTKPAAQQPNSPIKLPGEPAVGKTLLAKSARSANPVKGIFAWPVKGKLLTNSAPQGQKVYKGIEIGVTEGTYGDCRSLGQGHLQRQRNSRLRQPRSS